MSKLKKKQFYKYVSLQLELGELSELSFETPVKKTPVKTVPASPEIIVTSASSTRGVSSTMSHGTRRRHDSDNDPPVE